MADPRRGHAGRVPHGGGCWKAPQAQQLPMCPHRPSSAQTPPYLLESPPSFGLCIELLADVRCLPRGAGFVVLGLSACATQFLVVDDSHEKTRSVVRTPLQKPLSQKPLLLRPCFRARHPHATHTPPGSTQAPGIACAASVHACVQAVHGIQCAGPGGAAGCATRCWQQLSQA